MIELEESPDDTVTVSNSGSGWLLSAVETIDDSDTS